MNFDCVLQGSIAVGKFADIVVWEPEVEFNLTEDHPVYFKHPVCLPSYAYSNWCLLFIYFFEFSTVFEPIINILPYFFRWCFVSVGNLSLHGKQVVRKSFSNFCEWKPCLQRGESC